MKRGLILGVIFVLFVLAGIAVLLTRENQHVPPLARTDLGSVTMVEDHKSVLSHWIEGGIRNAVLLNFDTHDDMKRIPPGLVDELQSLIAQDLAAPSRTGYLNLAGRVSDGNFVYAAVKLGIIREVYWVVPATFLSAADREQQLVLLLQNHRFPKEDMATFRFLDGYFKGNVEGIPFNICDIESLPEFNEPVVVSMDVDFMPVLAMNLSEELIATVRRSLNALFAKRYKVADTSVAYSVNGGHISTRLRWVGDMVVDALKNPDLLAAEPLPEHYSIMQSAERLLMKERFSDLLNYLFPVLEKDIYNPDVLMYMALALNGIGADQKAFNVADKACLNNKNYCYGLCEIGSDILRRKGLEEAEKFFTRAYDLNPEMAHSQFPLAQAMKEAGRFDDAIRYFSVFRDHYGPFPVDFYLGEMYALKGDEAAAMKYFDSGRHAIATDPYAWYGFGDTGAVSLAIEFYVKMGFDGYADELRAALRTQ